MACAAKFGVMLALASAAMAAPIDRGLDTRSPARPPMVSPDDHPRSARRSSAWSPATLTPPWNDDPSTITNWDQWCEFEARENCYACTGDEGAAKFCTGMCVDDMQCSVEATYTLDTRGFGSGSCPTGYEHITDPAVCKIAGAEVSPGIGNQGIVHPEHPVHGCFRDTQHNRIYMPPGTTNGGGHGGHMAPICMRAGDGDKPEAGNGDKPGGGPEPGDDSTETAEELAGVTPELDEEAPEPAVDAEALAACAQHKKRDACKAAEGSSCFWAGKNPKWKGLQADGPGAKCLPKKIKPSKPGMLKPGGSGGKPSKPGMIKPSGEKPAEPGRIDPSMPGGGGSVQEKPVKLCGAAACAADEFCTRVPQKTGGAKTCVKKDPCASTSCATEKADLECVATGASTKKQPLGKRASCMCANQCTSDSCPGNKTCATKMYKSKKTSKYPDQLSLDGKAYSYTCEIKCMGKRRTALFTNKLNAIKDKKGGGATGKE